MPWWASLILMALMIILWLSGRSNPDEVIGLLERLLAIVLALVVLFVGRSLVLEGLVLIFAICLPAAGRFKLVTERTKANRDVFMTF